MCLLSSTSAFAYPLPLTLSALHHPELATSLQVSEELSEVWRKRTGSLSDNDMMELDHHDMFDAHRSRHHEDDDDDDDDEDAEADNEAEDADL